jgi:hypothetical protein
MDCFTIYTRAAFAENTNAVTDQRGTGVRVGLDHDRNDYAGLELSDELPHGVDDQLRDLKPIRAHVGCWGHPASPACAVPRSLELLKIKLVRYLVARYEQRLQLPNACQQRPVLYTECPRGLIDLRSGLETRPRQVINVIVNQLKSGARRHEVLRDLLPVGGFASADLSRREALEHVMRLFAALNRRRKSVSDEALERGVHTCAGEDERRSQKVFLGRRKPPTTRAARRAKAVERTEHRFDRVVRADEEPLRRLGSSNAARSRKSAESRHAGDPTNAPIS